MALKTTDRWLTIIAVFLCALSAPIVGAAEQTPLEVGWIGPMSGPAQKYAAFQAATLAEADVNAEGGVAGRPLKLIFQDGKATSKEAVSAAHYLIDVAKVHYIVGGHCTPESFPISSIAEKSKVLMLAAITSSPKLTPAGDYIFRVTAVNTQGVDKLLPFIQKSTTARRYGVLHEETDYAQGLAEYFKAEAPKFGIEVAASVSYPPGEIDFRGLITRLKAAEIDGLYLSVQSPDAAVTILQRLNEAKMKVQLVGNELAGNAGGINPAAAQLFEGMVFSEPNFDPANAATRLFIERYKKRFGVPALPYGIWTAEAYDAVRVLAATIARCGDDVEKVKSCLYETKRYEGVSGDVGFDANGDGIRDYVLKIVHGGKGERL